MGSIQGRAGNTGAIAGFTFTGPGQDSGVIGVFPPPSAQYPHMRIWPIGWEKFSFQLTGAGTGYAITVYGTIDQATSFGQASNWFILPGEAVDSASGQWANPLLSPDTTGGQPIANALDCKSRLLALRATSAAAPGFTAAGSITLEYLVTS